MMTTLSFSRVNEWRTSVKSISRFHVMVDDYVGTKVLTAHTKSFPPIERDEKYVNVVDMPTQTRDQSLSHAAGPPGACTGPDPSLRGS